MQVYLEKNGIVFLLMFSIQIYYWHDTVAYQILSKVFSSFELKRMLKTKMFQESPGTSKKWTYLPISSSQCLHPLQQELPKGGNCSPRQNDYGLLPRTKGVWHESKIRFKIMMLWTIANMRLKIPIRFSKNWKVALHWRRECAWNILERFGKCPQSTVERSVQSQNLGIPCLLPKDVNQQIWHAIDHLRKTWSSCALRGPNQELQCVCGTEKLQPHSEELTVEMSNNQNKSKEHDITTIWKCH